jgi:hypothetical protein
MVDNNNNKKTSESTIDAQDLPKDTPKTLRKTADFVEEEKEELPKQNVKDLMREEPKKQQVAEEKKTQGKKHTIIHEGLNQKEYEKVGIPYVATPEDEKVALFERRTKGQWTRKVTSITVFRDIEEKIWLDWNEERLGNTDMKRKITETVTHVGRYNIPIPSERIEYDPDNEENRTVVENRPKEIVTAYHTEYSQSKLQELLDDCNPRVCEFIIAQEAGRAYSVTKKELEKYGEDFDTLYNLKADPNFKIVNAPK